MTPAQQTVLSDIERIKAELRTEGPYTFKSGRFATRSQLRAQLQSLARSLTQDDDREYDLKHGRQNDIGGRSRSPSFGKWPSDDEQA